MKKKAKALQKKQGKKEKEETYQKSTNVVEIDKYLYCEACKSMVNQTIIELHGKTKEFEVVEVMETICDKRFYE